MVSASVAEAFPYRFRGRNLGGESSAGPDLLCRRMRGEHGKSMEGGGAGRGRRGAPCAGIGAASCSSSPGGGFAFPGGEHARPPGDSSSGGKSRVQIPVPALRS